MADNKEIKAEDKPKEEIKRTPEPTVQEIETALFSESGARVTRARVWYRNILYYMGEQWIEWSKTKKRFEATWQYDGQTDPQPVSNIILDYVRAIKALYLNKDITYKVWPNSTDHDDIQAADLGGKVLEDMDRRDSGAIIDEQEATLIWMVLTGTGFIRDYPDLGLGQWIGNTGKKTGDVATEAIMPFNVYVGETAGLNLRKKPMVGIQGLKDKRWVEETFPSYSPGSDSDVQQGHDYQRTLQEMVGAVSEWKSAGVDNLLQGAGLGGNGATIQDGMVLFREIEIAPSVTYPNGRYIVRVGGQTLVDVPRMPIPVAKDGTWKYTLEDIRHNLIPGSFWGEPGTNSLISPQNTINRIDQALIKNRDDVAKPTITTPIGTTFKTKSHRGSSIKVVEFDPITAGGTVPQVTHGKALPSQVLQEREVQMAVSQDSSGDPKGVLRGRAPSGSSGVMIDILKETAEAGHGPDISRIIRAFQRSASKRLAIAQELYTEKRVLKISGADGKISVRHFKGSDLRSNHDVRLEATTGFSSTQAGKVATVSGLIANGLFNPQITDRKTKTAVTRMMGLSGFDDKISPDEARAERENTLMANGEANKVYIEIPVTDEAGNIVEDPKNPGMPLIISPVNDPLFEIDNHEVHYEVWRQFAISPQFMDLSEADQTIAMAHGFAHKKRIDLANMQAQAAAMEQGEVPTQ